MKKFIAAVILACSAAWGAGTGCEICDCPAFQGSGNYCARCAHSRSYHTR